MLSFKVTQITFYLKLQCDQVEMFLIYVSYCTRFASTTVKLTKLYSYCMTYYCYEDKIILLNQTKCAKSVDLMFLNHLQSVKQNQLDSFLNVISKITVIRHS